MDFYNTKYYDTASIDYSDKRYNSIPNSFIKFFFQRRLLKAIDLIEKNCKFSESQVLIEDGCADGVVIQSVSKIFPKLFETMIGVDISPKMVSRAKEINKNNRISFFLKNEFESQYKADLFLAIGFVSPGIFDDEFSFIKRHLKSDGIAILSLPSINSLYAKLKLSDREVTKDYWSFLEYENFLNNDFIIIDK